MSGMGYEVSGFTSRLSYPYLNPEWHLHFAYAWNTKREAQAKGVVGKFLTAAINRRFSRPFWACHTIALSMGTPVAFKLKPHT